VANRRFSKQRFVDLQGKSRLYQSDLFGTFERERYIERKKSLLILDTDRTSFCLKSEFTGKEKSIGALMGEHSSSPKEEERERSKNNGHLAKRFATRILILLLLLCL
jgi:hypothetical protein